MTSMPHFDRVVTGGVDTHKEFHVAAALDRLGTVLGTAQFPATRSGYLALMTWLESFGSVERVGVEGTGSWGKGLTQVLVEGRIEVVEVLRPNRQTRRRHGKSDVIDAIAAGRAVLNGEASGESRGPSGPVESMRLLAEDRDVVEVPTRLTGRYRTRAGRNKTDRGDAVAIAQASLADECCQVTHRRVVETLRVLVTQRESFVKTQTETANRVRARLRELDPQAAATARRLRGPKAFQALTNLAVDHNGDLHREALINVIALDAGNWLTRYHQIRDLEKRIAQVLPDAGHALTDLDGIGLIGAATIIANTADIDRFPTEGHYASYCGTAPLDASSGRQTRHRLNRYGNRAINRVLHTAIVTQIAHHGEAYDYVTRRIQENKTKKEAIRTAARYLNRRVYNTLKQHPLT